MPREEVFVTTKFYPGAEDPEAEAEQSLERLGRRAGRPLPHPLAAGRPTWAWPGWSARASAGYARSIGVAQLRRRRARRRCSPSHRPPVVNQVQFSPFKYRRALLEACERARHRCSRRTARSGPGGTSRTSASRGSPSARPHAGPGAAALGVQRESRVIPKSTHRERIEENAQIFDFTLSDEDMAALDALDETGGTGRALERKWW